LALSSEFTVPIASVPFFLFLYYTAVFIPFVTPEQKAPTITNLIFAQCLGFTFGQI